MLNKQKFFLAVISFIVLDQISKVWFSRFDLVKNFGLSFALNFGTAANIILVAVALGFFGYYFWTKKSNLSDLQKIGFVLILSGAISNLIDRLILGYVRDFIDVGLGFTFNLADLFVAIGLIIIFWLI